MRNRWRLGATIAALATAPVSAAMTSPAANPVLGVWANPRGTLAVRTKPCGAGLCGVVVWAAPRTLAEARDAGIATLVGAELFQGYRAVGRGAWAGRVYVPNMRRSFSSRLRLTAPDRLTISGCVLAGWLCRTQQWHRLA